MSVIQNQQTSLLKFLLLNNVEVSNHGRTFSSVENLNVSDVETASGRLKRFYKNNRKTFTFFFAYFPSSSDKTVDGRAGRDFIYDLALNSPYVLFEYKDSPDQESYIFNGFITNYQETIVRRDLRTQCIYYNLQFDIEEQ
jgi:hypothetical protein